MPGQPWKMKEGEGTSPFPLCFVTAPAFLLSPWASRAELPPLLHPEQERCSPRLTRPPSPPGEAADGQGWGAAPAVGCLGRAAAVPAGKHGAGGGCQGRGRGMRGQMAACTGSFASVGNSVWEVAQIGLLPPKKNQSGLDYSCGHLHHDNNLLPCTVMPVRGGHTTSDLPTCCISSFYPLVLISDFSG